MTWAHTWDLNLPLLMFRSAGCASMSVYPVRAVSLCINNSVFAGKWRRERLVLQPGHQTWDTGILPCQSQPRNRRVERRKQGCPLQLSNFQLIKLDQNRKVTARALAGKKTLTVTTQN